MGAAPGNGTVSAGPRSEYRFQGFRFETDSRLLYEGTREVVLPPRALAVLLCFLEQAGSVLTKDELLERCWPESFVSEDSLTHAVSLIRQALDDDPRQPRFVQTLPRRGYRFVAEVESTADIGGSEPPPASSRSTAPPAAQALGRGSAVAARLVGNHTIWLVAALLVAVILAAVWSRDEPGTRSVALPNEQPIQIARLGLEDLAPTGSPLESEVADAVTPALANLIERETKLTVVRLASDGVTEREADVDAVLSVDLVVAGERISIAARVRSAAADDNWWRQEWDIPADLFQPDDFARSLLTRLNFLLDHASIYSTLRPSNSKEATLLVVQAAELFIGPAQRDLGMAMQTAELLRRASVLDEDFARPRAGRFAVMAEAVGWRTWTVAELAQARQEIETAHRSDPNDPVVHIASALYALMLSEVEESRQALDRARVLAPDNFWVYLVGAKLELLLGQPTVALSTARRGLELDPYQLAMHGRLFDVHLEMDDLDAAGQVAATLESLDPGGFWGGRAEARILWRRGLLEEAESRLLALRDRWADAAWIHRELADFYTDTGRPELAARERATLAR